MSNKPFLGLRPYTWVFVTLVTLTFVTFYIGEKGLGGLTVALFVLGIAMIKGHLVGAYFMGLGNLRGLWRWPVSIWLIIPGSLITTAFILSN
ncbi:cytochrome C oxidase subunit IV family protein [Sedimenticola sp.]|uniref:cytochrome C oxidase subunit IV family protein n=1 Tax=Sedimenticola sp. TaxID=1940285 RepID=UPI003D0A9F38